MRCDTLEKAEGIAEPSFLAAELEAAAGRELSKEEVDDIKGVAGGIFAGGTETVSILTLASSLPGLRSNSTNIDLVQPHCVLPRHGGRL